MAATYLCFLLMFFIALVTRDELRILFGILKLINNDIGGLVTLDYHLILVIDLII
jgi:hypothetical protein